jgi:hypothetical protein
MNDQIISLAEKERDEFIRNRLVQNSIPPIETLEGTVAETNIQALSWEDFLSKPDQEDGNSWLINGLLRSGWLVALAGHGKHGKTTLAIHMLNKLRSGGKFVSQCIKSPVIYLNCEMSPQDAKDLIRDVTINTDSTDCETAKIINEIRIPLDLSFLEQLLSKEPKRGVCLIDSFRGAFLLSGDTENNAGVVGGILRRLQLIARKTKWTIVIIHHFRKSGTGEALDLAGSGEWLSAPDAIFTWTCQNFKEPGTLNVTGRIPPQEPLSIQINRTNIEFLGTTIEQNTKSEEEKIKTFMSPDEGVTSDDLAKITEIAPATVRRRLESLRNKSEVICEGVGVKGSPHKWRLVENKRSCGACKGTSFWQRFDGELVCSMCHPKPN